MRAEVLSQPPSPSPDLSIQVLLATFNGERFLREQIDSILAQTLPFVSILARDDGSTDCTVDILNGYAQRFPERLRILPTRSSTGGAKANFLELLKASTADYVAFADQDDLWLPDKLAREMEEMRELEESHGAEGPLLVFCDLRVVNDNLETLASSFWTHRHLEPRNIGRLERLLMENVVTGCTALINRPLAQLSLSMPPDVHMHDWWIALLTCIFGHAAFIEQPLVLYRQHSANVIGALRHPAESGVRRWIQHSGRASRWEMSVHQATELLQRYPETLPPQSANTLRALLDCESSGSNLGRIVRLLRHRFFINRIAANLATAWYLFFRGSRPPKK